MKSKSLLKDSQLSKDSWLSFLDISKGVAIILVVYGHVIEHSMAPWNPWGFFNNPVFKIIYTFHMPLFVFISGYLMANSLNRRSVQEVFQSRYKSLFIPFMSLTLLGIIVAQVLNIVFGNNAGGVDILRDLEVQLLIKPSVWFLLTLFAVSSLLLFSVRLEQRFGLPVFAGIYFLLMLIPSDYCALYYIKWFYLFYLAGYFFNRCKIKIPAISNQRMIFVAALVVFGLLISFWTADDYIYINKMNLDATRNFDEILRVTYRYLMGFLGIIIIFYMAQNFFKTKAASFLGQVGIYSLDIYIIQMFIVEGVYPRFIYKAGIHLDFNSPYVLFIVAPLITMFFVGTCMLISKLVIRKSQLLNKLLLGGRN